MKIRFLVLAAAFAAASAGSARAASDVSTNWSGYAVSGATFSSVSGSWVQPKATCSTAASTSAAFWVGLGGNSEISNALEQIGTSTDCDAGGTASYTVWYELVPAASVPIRMTVAAGDKLWASVKVKGTKVTLEIRNLMRKTSFAKTLTMAAPDVSSAEWIAEAPSACDTYGRCRQVTLTDFGSVAFTKTLAMSGSHTGAIANSLWTATSIELRAAGNFGPFAAAGAGAQAVPTALAVSGSAFSITYAELAAAGPDPYARY